MKGRVGIDSFSGRVYASPKHPGNYTAWLTAVDMANPAVLGGISSRFDQVLIYRWNLEVLAQREFLIESYVVVTLMTHPRHIDDSSTPR